MQQKLIDAATLAEHFGVHKNTIYNWVEAGMPVIRPSAGLRRFDLAACIQWMAERAA